LLESGLRLFGDSQPRNARRQLEALGYDVIITLREDAA
jgi:hypothetical protein